MEEKVFFRCFTKSHSKHVFLKKIVHTVFLPFIEKFHTMPPHCFITFYHPSRGVVCVLKDFSRKEVLIRSILTVLIFTCCFHQRTIQVVQSQNIYQTVINIICLNEQNFFFSLSKCCVSETLHVKNLSAQLIVTEIA